VIRESDWLLKPTQRAYGQWFMPFLRRLIERDLSCPTNSKHNGQQ